MRRVSWSGRRGCVGGIAPLYPALCAILLFSGCYLSHQREDEAPGRFIGACVLPSPSPRIEPTDLCAFTSRARSAHPVPLVFFVGEALLALDGGGALIELHAFGADPRATDRHLSRRVFAARNRYAAAAGTWIAPGDPETVLVELVLVDLVTRSVVAHHFEEVPYESWGGGWQLFGNESGLFLYGLQQGDFTRMLVLSPEWTASLPVAGLTVATDPDELGNVGVRRVRDPDPMGPNNFWMSLCTLELTPMRVDRSWPAVGESVLAGTAEGLLLESPSSLDVVAPGDHTRLAVRLSPSNMALVATSERDRYRSHSLEEASTSEFRIQVPEGLRRMRADSSREPTFLDLSATRDAAATSDGSLLLAFRDDRVGRVYSTRDGSEWTPIGAPLGQVYDARGFEVAGTYFVFGDTFAVDVGPWPDEVEGRLDGHTVQLLRPASGLERVLEQAPVGRSYNRRYQVTGDGTCVAWLSGRSVTVLSASTGAELEVDLSRYLTPSSFDDSLSWATDSRLVSGPRPR